MRAAGMPGAVRIVVDLSLNAKIPPRRGLPSCREKGSEAVIRHVHGMAVPADGRCVRVDGTGGPGTAAGVPVVLVAGGVLVWLLAACPLPAAGAEDLHTAGQVLRLRGDSCAVAGVRPGPAAGRGRVGRRGDRAGRGRGVRGPSGGGRGGGAAYDGAGLGPPVRGAGW